MRMERDMDQPIIKIRDLHYQYPDGTQALKGISLEIARGEAIAVIGGNGAGKSTLLMHLNGTLTPQKGRIGISGIEVTQDTLKQIRQKVGMVFQNPDDQLFMPTVSDDVAFGPINMGLSGEDVANRVQEALEEVNAWEIRNKAPHHLSGGEKRSVSIATILSMKPDILAMDEPASGLDPQSRRNLINLLNNFPHTKIIATHDLDMALDVCSRCVILKKGEIAAIGETATLFRDLELLKSCHLEQPYRMQH